MISSNINNTLVFNSLILPLNLKLQSKLFYYQTQLETQVENKKQVKTANLLLGYTENQLETVYTANFRINNRCYRITDYAITGELGQSLYSQEPNIIKNVFNPIIEIFLDECVNNYI